MPVVRARCGNVHLWLVGSNPGPDVQRLAGEDVTVTGYVTDEKLAEFYRTARVAVVPLRIGAGVKGKVIEALHHGIPLVTTSIGAQGLEGLGTVVPVADEAAAIAQHVIALLEDDERWRSVAAAGAEYARQRFSRSAMEKVLRMDVDPGAARESRTQPARPMAEEIKGAVQ
jgi:glycosyltransferase involved in cell wall biosynthesis